MTVRRNVGGPTSPFEVLPDDVYNELIPQLKKDVGNLMLVSQRVYTACAKAQLGWMAVLPERYRWVPNPRKIVIDAWKEEQNIRRATGCSEGYLPNREGVISWSAERLVHSLMVENVRNRMISLSPWRARDSKSEITHGEITQWVAIETLLIYAIELGEAWPVPDSNHYCPRTQSRGLAIQKIVGGALLAREYLSPRLFHALVRNTNLINSFFDLFCDPFQPLFGLHHLWWGPLGDIKWEDIARFVLEKYCPIGLCACWPKNVRQLETWFGSELRDLSTEYRIFGVQGLSAFKDITKPKMVEWREFLLQSMRGSTGPREIPLSYLQSLVRVSKYVFHDPEQLVRFIISVVQKGYEKALLKVRVDTSSVDEVLVDFERRLKGIVEHVVEQDDAPFCPNPEYEKERDFIDGALGPYLIERFVRAP